MQILIYFTPNVCMRVCVCRRVSVYECVWDGEWGVVVSVWVREREWMCVGVCWSVSVSPNKSVMKYVYCE